MCNKWPALPDGEIHVWLFPLDTPEDQPPPDPSILSPEERTRGERFATARLRHRFIAGRTILRRILGSYLGREPAALPLVNSATGKPELADTDIRFNLAHTAETGTVGVCRRHPIGVDIEQIRAMPNMTGIVNQFFSPREQEEFDRRVAPEQRLTAFYRGWTRKEAYLKGRGEGLLMPLNCFSVTLMPGEPATLREHRDDPGEVSRWQLLDFEGPGAIVGCVAVASQCPMVLRQRGFS